MAWSRKFEGNRLLEFKRLLKEGWSISYASGSIRLTNDEIKEYRNDPEIASLIEIKRREWMTKYKNSDNGPRVPDWFIKANVKKQWGD